MKDLNKIRIFYKLKSVNRLSSVDNRKENPAEHTWSALILADYFITEYSMKINRLKVYELLMYHDVVEIEAGDTPMHPNMKNTNQRLREEKASKILAKKIPKSLENKYLKLFKEFEEHKTIESKFAKAIEQLDAEIHEMDYKKDWKGWTEEFLRKHKQKYFIEFPEIMKFFEETIKYCKENDYFDQ